MINREIILDTNDVKRNKMAVKERIVWIDEVKGFAILLMVMGHAVAWNYRDSSVLQGGPPIYNFIYSFHMHLLFFISAYTSYKAEICSFAKTIHRIIEKFERLMLPYFLTGFLLFITRGTYGYWFLLTLFEFYSVYYLLSWLSQIVNKKQNVLLECSIYIIPWVIATFLFKVHNFQMLNPMDIGKFYTYYPFFTLGVFSSKYKLIEKLNDLFFSVALILFSVMFIINNKFLFGFPVSYVFHNVIPLCAIIMCVYLFKKKDTGHEKIQSMFSYLGKNTLGIYMFHICFVAQIYEIGDFILAQNNVLTRMLLELILSLVNASIAIVLSLISIKILHASRILSYLLLGEKSSNSYK
jgi:fucose 4-O-acetylase-like acetyltransferase